LRPNKLKPKAAGLSRGRMLLKRKLGWQQGFPLDNNQWCEVHPGMVLKIHNLDGNLTRRSTYTINLLKQKFPLALPRLVGDTGKWVIMQKALLQLIKSHVHDHVNLPLSPLDHHPHASEALLLDLRKLRVTNPGLSPVITSFEWYGWTDLIGLQAAVPWLAKNGKQLEVISSNLEKEASSFIIRLFQFHQTNGKRVQPLVDFLSCEIIWRRPLQYSEDLLHELIKNFETENGTSLTFPGPDLSASLVKWVLWLSQQDKGVQRNGLNIFNLFFVVDLTQPWSLWWSKMEETLNQVQHQVKMGISPGKENPDWIESRSSLESLVKQMPFCITGPFVEDLLFRLCAPDQKQMHQVYCQGMKNWPVLINGYAVRLIFAMAWFKRWNHLGREVKPLFLNCIRHSMRYIDNHECDPQFTKPWENIFTNWKYDYPYTIEIDIIEDIRCNSKINTYFSILGQDTAGLEEPQAEFLIDLVAILPADQVRPVFEATKDLPLEEDADVYIDEVKRAADLAKDNSNLFSALLKEISGSELFSNSDHKQILLIQKTFKEANLNSEFLHDYLKGNSCFLKQAVFKIATIASHSKSIPGIYIKNKPDLDWLINYPASLHSELVKLARVDRQATNTAEQILLRYFPIRDDLQLEISHLRTLPQQTKNIQQRISNLEQRLSYQRIPSPKRISNLKKKLSAVRQRRLWQQYLNQIDAHFLSALQSSLGLKERPDWLKEPKVQKALAHVISLPKSVKSTVNVILKQRLALPPWDLRALPANASFLSSMEKKGLNLDSWLNDGQSSALIGDNKFPVLYGLERDPIEILNMGGHFRTCLSPDQFNYFSVFANIADINKQVLYVRDDRGEVISRTLLALTNDGYLLTFHIYCHKLQEQIKELTTKFVHDLATKMGTSVVATGNVKTLVASDWYDDGPDDLTQPHPALADGSSLRNSLGQITPDQFLAAVNNEFEPMGLNALTLQWLLALPELEARPDLVHALMPFCRQGDASVPGLMMMAKILRKHENKDDLRHLVAPVSRETKKLIKTHGYYSATECITFLVEEAPEIAYRFIKQTRPKKVKHWSDEHADRLQNIARIHVLLKRPVKAREMFKFMLEEVSYSGCTDYYHEMLGYIDEHL